MKKNSQFDGLAVSYYNSVPEIPQSYIELLKKTFAIKQTDSIIDLGCGSGTLTLALAEKAARVYGIDDSHIMIELAKKKDKTNKVTWTYMEVEDFDFGIERYDVITAFEAFHLFLDKRQLLQKCAKALKPGGYLSVGWARYEWESQLRETIEKVFAKYGSPIYKWGSWACPSFAEDVERELQGFSLVQHKEISIPSSTPIEVIINFLFSTSQTYFMDKKKKPLIIEDLRKQFLQIYPLGISTGESKYNLMFSQKHL